VAGEVSADKHCEAEGLPVSLGSPRHQQRTADMAEAEEDLELKGRIAIFRERVEECTKRPAQDSKAQSAKMQSAALAAELYRDQKPELLWRLDQLRHRARALIDGGVATEEDFRTLWTGDMLL